VQIILVNTENRAATLDFFAHRKKIAMPKLPMITGDNQLIKIFTREGYPYSVWIDGDGIVRYITAGYNTTEEHIRSLLNKQAPTLSRSTKSKEVSWLTTEPWKEDLVFFSALARNSSIHEAGNSISPFGNGRSVRLSSTASIIDLFRIAFSGNDTKAFRWKGSLALEVKDTVAYTRPKDLNRLDEWLKRYKYNYELIVPASRKDELYTIMQEELCRYFGVKARFEKRMVTCMAFVRTSNTDLLKTAGGKPSGKLYTYYKEIPEEGSLRVLVNRPFTELSDELKNEVEAGAQLPFVDETGYEGNIDISIPWATIQAYDAGKWRQALKKYGLDLIEKPRMMNVLVISDN
jgi:hypothetical protein